MVLFVTHCFQAVGMCAEGVRRGKNGIGDSIEKQVHEEKKGINN